jgi:PTS system fructose-specific IIB component
MGAESLENTAEEMGHDIRVEIQGSMGAENELTSEEIAAADAVIIAADISVSRDRFEGKPLVKAPVADAINGAEDLIEQALTKAEEHSPEASDTAAESSGPEPTDTTPREGTDTASKTETDGLIGKLKRLFS